MKQKVQISKFKVQSGGILFIVFGLWSLVCGPWPAPAFAAPLNNSFNSGELSPLLKYRVDLDKRYMGVEKMENMLAWQQGGSIRRPGTKYISTVTDLAFCQYPALRPCDDAEAPAGAIQISTPQDLQDISLDLAADYEIMNDIDMTGFVFTPIGTTSTPFTGTLQGHWRTISNLTINKPTTDNVGLFGVTYTGAEINNVKLTNANITGKNFVGGMVGKNSKGSFLCCEVTGTITSTSGVAGGFAGGEQSWTEATFTKCSANITLTKTGAINAYYGGFTGRACAAYTDCYAQGSITAPEGSYGIGGFAGDHVSLSVFTRCYAAVVVPQPNNTHYYTWYYASWAALPTGGGFIAVKASSTFTDCYWDTDVSSSIYPDGGENEDQQASVNTSPSGGTFTITFDGKTTSAIDVAPTGSSLITRIQSAINSTFGAGVITASFAGGSGAWRGGVPFHLFYTGGDYARANVANATVTASYIVPASIVTVSAQNEGVTPISGDIAGKTTSQMKIPSTFENWDFDTVWTMPPEPCRE